MTKAELQRVRQWADDKLVAGEEPPWAWYQYMKLRETLDAILAGMAAITPPSSQGSAPRSDTHLRLVAGSDLQDTVPHRPAGLPVQMPM